MQGTIFFVRPEDHYGKGDDKKDSEDELTRAEHIGSFTQI